ncbi:MAG: hypothetical protein IT443_10475 [Phycisphaeraceae bacterium]|nr:hypothetical protein [Phycisphaeraceae bacterium]
MLLKTTKVDVWAAPLEDRPGAISEKLVGLAKAGVDLDFIVARRCPERPGQGVLFVTPLSNAAQEAAAAQLQFHRTQAMHSVRIEGPDEPGTGYLITHALATAGINIRGVSGATLGGRFVMLLAFDTAADADLAMRRLNEPL